MESKPPQNKSANSTPSSVSHGVPKPIDMDAPIGLGGNLKASKKENVFDVTRAFENPHSETGVIVNDKRRTGPSVGESFVSAFSEWWGGTISPKTPIETNTQVVPPKPPTQTPSVTPQKAEIITKKPTIAGKVEQKTEEQKSEAPRPEIVHPYHGALEKTRTFKKDVARLTEQKDVVGDTEEKNIPSTTKVTPPKAVRMGPLTVPDVRTSTIAPLVRTRAEVPNTPQQKDAPDEPVILAQRVSIPQPLKKPETVSQPLETPPPEPFEAPRTFASPISLREPVKHDEIFTQDESIEDTTITDELPTLEEKLEFHSTLDQTLLERRKNEVLRSQRRNAKSAWTWASLLQETSTSWMALFVLMFLGAIVAIVVSVYIHVTENTTEVVAPPITAPSFFETEAQTTVTLPSDESLFLTTLKENIRTAKPGVVQLYPTVFENGVERPVTSSEFFTAIHSTLNEGAIRTLDDTIMMGSVTTSANEPYLILRTNDFDTLFSAFLLWEQTMQADLSPLFGEAFSSQKTFNDSVWNNRSTRTLTGEAGQTLLLYSFVNQNTVVITQSEEALSILLEKF